MPRNATQKMSQSWHRCCFLEALPEKKNRAESFVLAKLQYFTNLDFPEIWGSHFLSYSLPFRVRDWCEVDFFSVWCQDLLLSSWSRCGNLGEVLRFDGYLGFSPLPVIVNPNIIACFVGDAFPPSKLLTITRKGRKGDNEVWNPNDMHYQSPPK